MHFAIPWSSRIDVVRRCVTLDSATAVSRAYFTGQIHRNRHAVFDSIDEYYATLFHELVHSTGHSSRLKRFETDDYTDRHRNYGIEELVAEIGAAMLCSEAGIDNSAVYRNSASYLSGWMNAIGEDKNMIVYAASRAQKAVDMILGTALEGEREQPIAA